MVKCFCCVSVKSQLKPMLIYLLLRLSLHVPISSQTGPRLSSSAFQSSNYFSIRDNSSHPFFLLTPADSALRSAVLEDCALCQETISSTELAAKAREGQFEGQRVQKQTHIKHTCQLAPFSLLSASGDSSAVCVLFFFPSWLCSDPPDWVPDDACNSCIACKAPFTVIRRKHHCRSCGKVCHVFFLFFGEGVQWTHLMRNHWFVISDLLLPLLFSFCSFASIWPS